METLPPDMIQMLASWCTDPIDLAHFRATCRYTYTHLKNDTRYKKWADVSPWLRMRMAVRIGCTSLILRGLANNTYDEREYTILLGEAIDGRHTRWIQCFEVRCRPHEYAWNAALRRAAGHGDVNQMAYCLSDVGKTTLNWIDPSIYEAAKHNHIDAVLYLLNFYNTHTVRARALKTACVFQHIHLIKTLLAHGCENDLNTLTWHQVPSTEVLDLLVRHGMNAFYGICSAALRKDNQRVVEWCVQHGVIVNDVIEADRRREAEQRDLWNAWNHA